MPKICFFFKLPVGIKKPGEKKAKLFATFYINLYTVWGTVEA